MAGIVERRASGAARWSRRLASFAAMLFLVSGLGHRYGRIDTVAFLWLLGIIGALAVGALCAAALGFVDLWQRGEKGGRSSTFGAILALIVLAPFLLSGWRFFTHPALTDVSTDLIDPPMMPLAARDRTPSMNPIVPPTAAAAELQLAAYPEATGRRYEAAPDRVLDAVLAEAAARGWTVRGSPVVPADGGDLTVEATAYSFFLGFPSDVAVRLTDEGASTYVDMRSVSRYGRNDLGDNGRRVGDFLAALDAAIKAQPSE
ncbi:MAG: DUF1499 domain-containing protein [Mesorhizobium sp.]|nr:DUF1499 domain-containing protein [Mesorhizobium sp.]